LLFIGSFRSTAAILLSIPLSIMVAVVGLYFTDNSLNVMTLGGLALAVGRLLDDSIVVLENTHRHLAMGKPPPEAAHDAALEVRMPIFVSTIVTVVVFAPVVFLSGIGKFLFTPLALSVTFSMLASYLVALTVVPVYCWKFLRHMEGEEHQYRWFIAFDRTFERAKEMYGRALRRILGWRLASITIA